MLLKRAGKHRTASRSVAEASEKVAKSSGNADHIDQIPVLCTSPSDHGYSYKTHEKSNFRPSRSSSESSGLLLGLLPLLLLALLPLSLRLPVRIAR